MANLKKFSTEELVDSICVMERKKKELDEAVKEFKTELQLRGMEELADRNVKTVTFAGMGANSVTVSYAQSVGIINYFALKELLGELGAQHLTENSKVECKLSGKLSDAAKIILSGDYESGMTLDEALPELDSRKKELLKKKLKGDYKKDRELLTSVLDGSEGSDVSAELYCIHKIKMWEKIEELFPEKTEEFMEGIRKTLSLTETPKLTVKYKE